MNQLLNVFITGNPKGQPRPRAFSLNGKARMYDPSTAEGWKALVANAVQTSIPERPYECPVEVKMIFHFERPKSHYTSKGELTKAAKNEKFYHTSKPDFDNLEKAVSDCLKEIRFWKDDTQVIKWSGAKVWTKENPGLLLIINSIKS